MINNGNLNWGTLFSKKTHIKKITISGGLGEGKKTSLWYGPINNSILIPNFDVCRKSGTKGHTAIDTGSASGAAGFSQHPQG